MSMYSTIKGVVSRSFANTRQYADGNEGLMRLWKGGEQMVLSSVRKQHLLADQGVYFVCNNAQTGIATPAVTSFGATTPLCIIQNTDSAGGKNVYVDYIKLVTTAAGSFASAGVNLQVMVYLDLISRYSSGGTNLTANITSPNSATSKSSVAQIYFGAVTALAAGGSVRPIVGLDILRPVVSATVADVVGERKVLNFGGVEASFNGSVTVANANFIPVPMPPLIVGPGHSALIYYVMNGTTPAAASYAPEFGFWEM